MGSILDPKPITQAAAAKTYVRFVDENGNALSGKRVTIKVDSTTGEIIDIVSEAN